jgi:tetratricopeptide (TPR) repeat protein
MKSVIFKYGVLNCILFAIPLVIVAQAGLSPKNLHTLVSHTENRFFSGFISDTLLQNCSEIIKMAEKSNRIHLIVYGKLLKMAVYTEQKKTQEAKKWLDSVQNNAIIDKNPYYLGFKTLYQGVLHYRMNNLQPALKLLNMAEKHFLKDSTIANQGICLSKAYKYIGRIYAEYGVYAQAIEMYLKGINLLKGSVYEPNKYELHRFAGRAYFVNRKLDSAFVHEALKNYHIALAGFKKYGRKHELPWTYSVLADFYLNGKNPVLARKYQDSCLMLAKQDSLADLIGLCYNNYGEIDFQLHKYQNALKNLQRALFYYEIAGNVSNRIVTLGNLAETYSKLNKIDSAGLFATKSLNLAMEYKSYQKIARAYLIMANLSSEMNNHVQALENYKNHHVYSDSAYHMQNMRIAYAIGEIYKNEEQEIENLRLENENQEKDKRIKSVLIFFLSFGILAVLAIFMGIFSFFRLKRKKETQLHHETKRLLNEKYHVKEATIRDTERELHGVTNDLLAVAKSLKSKDKLKEFYTETTILEVIDGKIRNLQSQLKVPGRFANLMVKLESLQQQQFYLYDFTLLIDIDVNIDWEIIPGQIQEHLYRICQLLLNNSNIHAKASEVAINCFISKKSLNLMYNDDGIGYDPLLVPKDRGLGEIRDRLFTIQGKIFDESKIGYGCAITIEIPNN